MTAFFRTLTATVIAACATVLTVAGAAPAGAETVTARISAAGIDLASPAGRAALDGAVRRTARSLCDSANAYDLAAKAASQRCVRGAIERSAPQVAALATAAQQASIGAPVDTLR